MKSYNWIFFFVMVLLFSCQFDPKQRNAAKTNEAFNNDSIISIEVAEPNVTFKVDDSAAIALIQKVPEFRQIIDYKYDDTTIFNQLHIENIPTAADNNWRFNIVQFHPATGHVASLMWLLVNANTGDISIWDIPKDTVISIDYWLKTRTINGK